METVANDMEYFANTYAHSPVFDMFEKPVMIWSGGTGTQSEPHAAERGQIVPA